MTGKLFLLFFLLHVIIDNATAAVRNQTLRLVLRSHLVEPTLLCCLAQSAIKVQNMRREPSCGFVLTLDCCVGGRCALHTGRARVGHCTGQCYDSSDRVTQIGDLTSAGFGG